MIAKENLDIAAKIAQKYILESIPPDNGTLYVFSERFERKMRRLIRKVDDPIQYWVNSGLKCAVIALVIIGCALFVFNTDVQAAVINWVKSVFGEYHVYQNVSDTAVESTETGSYSFKPEWLPDGYYEYSVSKWDDQMIMVYKNDADEQITIGFYSDESNVKIYAENEGSVIKSVFVNGNNAELYMDYNGGNNLLVWSVDNNVISHISSRLTETEIVRIAENINAQQNVK